MKKILLAMLACASLPALADQTAVAVSGSQSNASTSAQSNSTQGNEQAITFNGPEQQSIDQKASGKTKVATVATLYSPSINATAPCLVPVSGGVTWVGFGIAGGSAIEDKECTQREKNRIRAEVSRSLYAIGQPQAAAKLMCNDPEVAVALGAVCNDAGAPVGTPKEAVSLNDQPLRPAAYQIVEPKIVPAIPDQSTPHPAILQPKLDQPVTEPSVVEAPVINEPKVVNN